MTALATDWFTLTNSHDQVVLSASTRETNQHSEYWLLGAPTGWYGGFTMRGDNEERLNHGAFPARRTRSARQLELKAKIHLRSWDEALSMKRWLSAALADGEQGVLEGSEGDLPVLSATVERTGEVLVGRSAPTTFTVSIPLVAPDPSLYGPWRETTLRPVGTGVGFRWPAFGKDGVQSVQPLGTLAPMEPVEVAPGVVEASGREVAPGVIELGSFDPDPAAPDGAPSKVADWGHELMDEPWVWNDGNVDSHPLFVVTANAPGGFGITMAGRTVTYPRPTFPDMPVTVDMAGSVSVSGADQSHLIGERSWSAVAPSSIEEPEFFLLQGGNGFCTVRHRDAYV